MENYFDKYVVAGGVMMYLIVPCSFLALGYIIQGFYYFRTAIIIPRKLIKRIESISNKEECDKVIAEINVNKSPIARILNHLLDKRYRENFSMEDIIGDTVAVLYQKTNALGNIYVVAPLLGLLGTIFGIMHTFENYSTSEGNTINNLSIGISEALITTIWGLLIAIPCFIFLNYFRHKIFIFEKVILPDTVNSCLKIIDEQSSKSTDE